MNESSRLFPASMRAQSDAAIAALRADNDALETAGKALDAFINDDANRSAAFENLRRKMQDFRAVADALIKANDSDIADHRRLIHLVGSQVLDGSVIIPQLESNLRSRAIAEDRIAHYSRVLSRVSSQQRLNGSDRTHRNARRSKQRWENYLRTVNRIITKLERKVRSYNEIERATRELLTSGGDLRSAAARGLEHIQKAAAGLPGSYDSEGLGAWRVDINLTKEKIAYALFNELFSKDKNANISEASWERIEELLAHSVEKIDDVEFGALWAVFASLEREEDLARFIAYASVGGFGNFPNNDISKEDIGTRIGEVAMGIAISLTSVISGLSQIFSPFIERNHVHNSQFEFSGMIFSQRHEPASLLEMGRHPGSYNGCGWIATYNALLLLGERVHPADIIRNYQKTGGSLINGEFGINPLVTRNNFKEWGYNVTMVNFPPSVDDLIRASTVSILTYGHSSGAHTVMVYYDNNVFHVFNDTAANSTSTAPGVQTSIDEWIESRDEFWMISATGIR